RILEVQIHHHASQRRWREAIETGQRAMQLLGEPLPSRVTKGLLVLKLVQIKLAIRRYGLTDLPNLTDPTKLAALRILTALTSAAYTVSADLYGLFVSLQTAGITLRHGYSGFSAVAFSTYAVVLAAIGDIDNAYEIGNVALELLDEPDAEQFRGQTEYTH